VTGKGFMPGVSGNAGGRPRGLASLARERTRDGALLIEFAVEILQGKPIDMEMVFPAKETGGQPTIVRYQQTPPPRLRLEAAMWLADRGWGKPIQGVAVQPGKPFTIVHRLLTSGQDPLAEAKASEVALEPVLTLKRGSFYDDIGDTQVAPYGC
jgi:hypothetical protein